MGSHFFALVRSYRDSPTKMPAKKVVKKKKEEEAPAPEPEPVQEPEPEPEPVKEPEPEPEPEPVVIPVPEDEKDRENTGHWDIKVKPENVTCNEGEEGTAEVKCFVGDILSPPKVSWVKGKWATLSQGP